MMVKSGEAEEGERGGDRGAASYEYGSYSLKLYNSIYYPITVVYYLLTFGPEVNKYVPPKVNKYLAQRQHEN